MSRVYTLLGRKPCNSGIQPDVQHSQRHHRLQLHSIGRSFHPLTHLSNTLNREAVTYSITLGPRAEQNLYTAELMAISMAIRGLPLDLQGRQITIFTSNQAALLALSQPKHQSGQMSIAQIYNTARTLR